METTTYESPFPSGLYEPNIQAEKRLNSPLTVAAARVVNRHDVEIRRIEEVIGVPVTGVPAGSMMDRIGVLEDTVSPSGIVHGHVSAFHTGLGDGIGITADPNGNVTIGDHTSDAILHYPKQFGNTLPFHSDAADENYKYIQWFLQWMGMWDALSVGGTITPSMVEVVKALWQNKWDLEILFEPEFLSDARRWDNIVIPDAVVWEYTAVGGESFFAGFETRDPVKPVGGACNLNTQPWPVYRAYCTTCNEWLEGHVTLDAGHVVQFFNWMATEAERLVMSLVDSGDDYWIGLFGNSPYTYVETSGDPKYSMPPSSIIPNPTGIILPPPLPPPPLPGPTGLWPSPPSNSVPVEDGILIETDHIKFGAGLVDVLKPNTGETGPDMANVKVSPAIKTASRPLALEGDPTSWVQIPGSYLYGGDMLSDAWQMYLPLQAGWNLIYAQVVSSIPWTPSNLHCYIIKSLAGDFVSPGVAYPIPEWDFPVTPTSHLANMVYTMPIGYVYATPNEAGIAIITFSEESRPPYGSPDQYYILGFLTRHMMLEYGS